jgi:hypothetical protein
MPLLNVLNEVAFSNLINKFEEKTTFTNLINAFQIEKRILLVFVENEVRAFIKCETYLMIYKTR